MKKNLKSLKLTKKTISNLQKSNLVGAHSGGTNCHTNSCGTRCKACKDDDIYTIVC